MVRRKEKAGKRGEKQDVRKSGEKADKKIKASMGERIFVPRIPSLYTIDIITEEIFLLMHFTIKDTCPSDLKIGFS